MLNIARTPVLVIQVTFLAVIFAVAMSGSVEAEAVAGDECEEGSFWGCVSNCEEFEDRTCWVNNDEACEGTLKCFADPGGQCGDDNPVYCELEAET